MEIILVPLKETEIDDFVVRNQQAFNKAVVEQCPTFKGNIISRSQILKSIKEPDAVTYNVLLDGEVVGGVILGIHEDGHNDLDILFVNVDCHSKGIGYAIWQKVEESYPDTLVWETHTPYFETRNIHFYINKCGFHMVEFFCKAHPEPFPPDDEEYETSDDGLMEGFCRFQKVMSDK